jgi:hypothetical protein
MQWNATNVWEEARTLLPFGTLTLSTATPVVKDQSVEN